MTVEMKTTCPLGHTCEQVVDGKVERCMWYVPYRMQNPQNTDEVIDEWNCTINWQTRFILATGRQVAGVQKATEEVRNKTHEGNAMAAKQIQIMANAPQQVVLMPRTEGTVEQPEEEPEMLTDERESA